VAYGTVDETAVVESGLRGQSGPSGSWMTKSTRNVSILNQGRIQPGSIPVRMFSGEGKIEELVDGG
jgi:hypothetical protein